MENLIYNMASDVNGGVCLKDNYNYYTFSGNTYVNVSGNTDIGTYIIPYKNTNVNYIIDIYDGEECLIITGLTSDWSIIYINSFVTTGYTGYNDSEIENRILYNQDENIYYKLIHIDNYSGCTVDTSERWAIINNLTGELWNGSGDYFYNETDDCGIKTGRQLIILKNININSDTHYQTKYIENIVPDIKYPITNVDTINNITSTGATINLTLSSIGDSFNITENGICYGIYTNSTIEDIIEIANGLIVGSYSVNISNLIPETVYYLKSYVKSELGTTYSNNEFTFKTL